MFFNVVRPVAIIIIWALNTDPSVSATITQATVATDTTAHTFDFEIVWSSPPNFATADSFKYNILNPTVAANCCSPFGGWSGFAASNADYQLIADTLSLYSGNDKGRTLIGPVPFSLLSNVLTFAIAFSVLNEPNGFVYELEHYLLQHDHHHVLGGTGNEIVAFEISGRSIRAGDFVEHTGTGGHSSCFRSSG